jgi:hypothetical protein
MSRPPKATSILDVTGAFDKNPNRKREGEPVAPAGNLDKPRVLKGVASKIWDVYAPICFGMGTLCHGDEGEFATWCVLQSQFEKDPDRFCEVASLIAQKRTTAEKFGIAGAGSRAKIAIDKGKESKDPADKYLTNVTSGPGNNLRQ